MMMGRECEGGVDEGREEKIREGSDRVKVKTSVKRDETWEVVEVGGGREVAESGWICARVWIRIKTGLGLGWWEWQLDQGGEEGSPGSIHRECGCLGGTEWP
jgi:hypothetical protein